MVSAGSSAQYSEILFERKRKEFAICQYSTNASNGEIKTLFNLDDEGSSSDFPFEELHSEYMVRIGNRMFLAWPLKDEAYIS